MTLELTLALGIAVIFLLAMLWSEKRSVTPRNIEHEEFEYPNEVLQKPIDEYQSTPISSPAFKKTKPSYDLPSCQISPPKVENDRQEVNSEELIIVEEAKVIAAKVKTVNGLTRLEERIDKAQERYCDAASEITSQKAEVKLRTLKMAYDLALDNVVSYFYNPDVSVHIPLNKLKYLFKTITPNKHQQLIAAGEFADHELSEITLSDISDYEDIQSFLEDNWIEKEIVDKLIEIRKIVESKGTHDEKINLLNEFAEQIGHLDGYEDLMWWDGYDDDITPGEIFFFDEMSTLYELPKPEEFFRRGFTNETLLLNLESHEVLSWKGFGPKTVEKFERFQENLERKLT